MNEGLCVALDQYKTGSRQLNYTRDFDEEINQKYLSNIHQRSKVRKQCLIFNIIFLEISIWLTQFIMHLTLWCIDRINMMEIFSLCSSVYLDIQKVSIRCSKIIRGLHSLKDSPLRRNDLCWFILCVCV